MFYGRYDHTLDSKKRLTLPARFREKHPGSQGGQVWFLTRGYDDCIFMFTPPQYEEFVDRMEEDEISMESMDFHREFFGSTSEVTTDSQGRVLLPDHLLELAGVSKSVVVLGVRSRIEIWDLGRHGDHSKSFEADDQYRQQFRKIYTRRTKRGSE
ncbi:MAG: cell division/cell wall cluster transcriptional repressor MraZ [Planctomycetota bacterium]|jgi:MraZ protein|nr:cell division/cell wall cluster transcriptional repressor MraZ [Planctomycetota bacterium]